MWAGGSSPVTCATSPRPSLAGSRWFRGERREPSKTHRRHRQRLFPRSPQPHEPTALRHFAPLARTKSHREDLAATRSDPGRLSGRCGTRARFLDEHSNAVFAGHCALCLSPPAALRDAGNRPCRFDDQMALESLPDLIELARLAGEHETAVVALVDTSTARLFVTRREFPPRGGRAGRGQLPASSWPNRSTQWLPTKERRVSCCPATQRRF